MKKHPAITSVTCCCAKGKHRAGCGCVTEGFIRNARISHFLVCIQAEKEHTVYAQRMREPSQYHAKGIHSWSGEQCSFHPALICSCDKCEDDNLHCAASRTRTNTFSHVSSMLVGMRSSLKIEPPAQTVSYIQLWAVGIQTYVRRLSVFSLSTVPRN